MKIIERALMNPQEKLLSCLGAEFLSMKDIQDLSKKLAMKIRGNYFPDIIVGIDRGGAYPAYCLSKEMHLPYTTIDISRDKRYLGNIEMTSLVLVSKCFREIREDPTIKRPFVYEGSARRALIVDDDCGSMKTLNMARLHLKEKGLESKASVILNTPQGTPDFFADMQLPLSRFIKGTKRFPWTQYSPHFQDYQSWVKNNLK